MVAVLYRSPFDIIVTKGKQRDSALNVNGRAGSDVSLKRSATSYFLRMEIIIGYEIA